MKRMMMLVAFGYASMFAHAGNTNFVAQFDAIWQTRNASNILVFVEQNVATNKSPETLFARGVVAMELQDWGVGATNYWEQVIQMISTNNAYAEIEKEMVLRPIQALQCMFVTVEKIDPVGANAPPSWNLRSQAVSFSIAKTPDLETLKAIANLPLAEN